MENTNGHGNQPPVIDPDYIDKLLSTYIPPAEEPAAPVETEAAPAPVSEAPPAPQSKPKRKSARALLLILAAIALLGVGFLLGRLSDTGAESPTASPDITAPTLSGNLIAPDYVSIPTRQLISIAVRIDGLSYYGSPLASTSLSPDIYEKMKQENPVLMELEQRPDAASQLKLYAFSVSDIPSSQAANALLGYYVGFLGFDLELFQPAPECEWIYQACDLLTVYEYTEAPSVYTAKVDGESFSGIATIFDFGVRDFQLHGQLEWPEEPNFWFRIEASDPAILEINPDPKLDMISDSYGAWMTMQKYGDNEGWFLFGYTPGHLQVNTNLYLSAGTSTAQRLKLFADPTPKTGLPSPELAQYLADSAAHICTVIAENNAHRDLATYGLIAELLSRDDGISSLLSLAQGSRYSDDDFDYTFSNATMLLELPCIQERMTDKQHEALTLMRTTGCFYAGNLHSRPTIDGNSISFPGYDGYRIGEAPESLRDIPMEEMDFWMFVPLTPGAQALQQDNWELGAEILGGGGVVGVWEWFDSSDGSQAGWLVSGKLGQDQPILLRLEQGTVTLQLEEVTALRLDAAAGETA